MPTECAALHNSLARKPARSRLSGLAQAVGFSSSLEMAKEAHAERLHGRDSSAVPLFTEYPMRLSRFFLPILKENPREAEIVSHRLMLRAGMLKQQAAGSFSWLPAGQKGARQGLRHHPRGAGTGGVRRARDPDADDPVGPICGWRAAATRPMARRCCAYQDRHGARHALRANQRGDGHRHLPRACEVLQGFAAQSLPHSSGSSATRCARDSASCGRANS